MTRSSIAPAAGIRPGLLGHVGRACHRHRWIALIGWLAAVACLIALRAMFAAAADNNFAGIDPGQAVLDQHFHRQSGDTFTLAISTSEGISSPAVRQRVTGALAPFQHAAHVASVSDPYQMPGQISRDGHIAFAITGFRGPRTVDLQVCACVA